MMLTRRALLRLSVGCAVGTTFVGRTLADDFPDPPELRQEAIISDHFFDRGVNDYVRYARIGDYKIDTDPTYTFLDEESEVEVLVFFSEDVRNPRLVVFSHGALAEPMVYRNLLNHWVSHGYIVVAPVHSDSVTRQGLNIRHADAGESAIWDFSGILNNEALWRDRTEVCNLVLDSVPLLNRTFGIEINDHRPIISGHSYGAFTAQLLLGAQVSTAEGMLSLRDPRWAGGLLMSPQGIGIMGLHEASWSEITRPLMVMTGGNDVDASSQDAARKADPFWRSPAGYKHFAYMEYAQHTIFTGQSARPQTYDERLFADIRAVSIAFLKAYADHDLDAFSHLQDDYFSAQSVEPDDPSTRRPKHSRIFMQTR